MELAELDKFRTLFALVDRTDPSAIRRWFEEYPELTISEHMDISGLKASTITRWRRDVGVASILLVERVPLATGRCHHRCIPPRYRPPQNKSGQRYLARLFKCSRRKIRKMMRPITPFPESLVQLLNE